MRSTTMIKSIIITGTAMFTATMYINFFIVILFLEATNTITLMHIHCKLQLQTSQQPFQFILNLPN